MIIIDKIKGALKSWTVWFNSIAGAVLMGLPMLQDSLPALQPYVNGNHYKHVMAGVIVVNIVLRFKTSKALEQK